MPRRRRAARHVLGHAVHERLADAAPRGGHGLGNVERQRRVELGAGLLRPCAGREDGVGVQADGGEQRARRGVDLVLIQAEPKALHVTLRRRPQHPLRPRVVRQGRPVPAAVAGVHEHVRRCVGIGVGLGCLRGLVRFTQLRLPLPAVLAGRHDASHAAEQQANVGALAVVHGQAAAQLVRVVVQVQDRPHVRAASLSQALRHHLQAGVRQVSHITEVHLAQLAAVVRLLEVLALQEQRRQHAAVLVGDQTLGPT